MAPRAGLPEFGDGGVTLTSHGARLDFPPGFLWGTCTSAHQVEGENDNNQWWAWEQVPGRVWHDQRSGAACKWWTRAEEDLATAAMWGQNAHRLSIEWSRIEPREGEFAAAPVERYRRLLGRMRELGIEPMVTLHHYTHPLWLEAQGGWLNPETVGRFERFAEYAAHSLGDLVRLWCTVNEPVLFAMFGYRDGIWPPGQHSLLASLRVLRNLLLGHAAAYHAVHRARPGAQVGLVAHIHLLDPANPASRLDRAATWPLNYLANELQLRAIADGRLAFPLTLGGRRVPALAGTSDFIGLNHYTRELVAFDARRPGDLFARRFSVPGAERNDPGWHDHFGDIYPEGLYRCLMAYARFGKPLYVTENGWADAADSRRPRALVAHLAQMWRAIADGAPVRGYYHWSLVDNFEWAEGWSARFGLIEVDPETQARRPRPSAQLYAKIARANAIDRGLLEQYAPALAASIVSGDTTSG